MSIIESVLYVYAGEELNKAVASELDIADPKDEDVEQLLNNNLFMNNLTYEDVVKFGCDSPGCGCQHE